MIDEFDYIITNFFEEIEEMYLAKDEAQEDQTIEKEENILFDLQNWSIHAEIDILDEDEELEAMIELDISVEEINLEIFNEEE